MTLAARLGERVVNGLWFWGGGAPLVPCRRCKGGSAGSDDFFNAFGAREHAGVGSGLSRLMRLPAALPGSRSNPAGFGR